MQVVLSLILCLSSLEWVAGTCPGCLSESYAKRKGSIETLLGKNGSTTVITAGLQSLKGMIGNPGDQDIFSTTIDQIEDIANGNFSIQQKLAKIGLQLDQLFVNNPAIEDAIRYQNVTAWGPLCDFQFIVDEMNIENFWTLATTRGTTTTACLLHDLILEASKPIKYIKWKLYLENIPCTMSQKMVSNIVNLHHDIPEGKYRLYLLSLELPGYDMTVNQVQRVARSYYSSKALTCRRLRDTYANYPASQMLKSQKTAFAQYLKEDNDAGLASSNSLELCIELVSRRIANNSDRPTNIQAFNKIFWNFPFGQLYENIIYNDCQINVLKEKASSYYN